MSDETIHHSTTEGQFPFAVDWEVSPQMILEKLESPDTSRSDLCAAVLFSGTTSFSENQGQRLLSGLARFIDENHFSEDDKLITIVGSAARTFAMYMGTSEFEQYAHWLLPEEANYINNRIELELVKGINWRLTFLSIPRGHPFPVLTQTLDEIARGYTTSRFLLQENFAAIALNAITSVFILEGTCSEHERSEHLRELVHRAGQIWFEQLLLNRWQETKDHIQGHDPALANTLADLIPMDPVLTSNE